MPSSSCFYLYTENLSLLVLLPIFACKKDTWQNLPVSLLYFSKMTHLYSIKGIGISSVQTSFPYIWWYGNGGNRLTWSSFLTLVPSGFAPLPFNRFAFKIISFFKENIPRGFSHVNNFFKNLHIYPTGNTTGLRDNSCYDFTSFFSLTMRFSWCSDTYLSFCFCFSSFSKHVSSLMYLAIV